MTYERFEIGDVIMREGDTSNNKMYVIIQGKVSIIKKIKKNVFA